MIWISIQKTKFFEHLERGSGISRVMNVMTWFRIANFVKVWITEKLENKNVHAKQRINETLKATLPKMKSIGCVFGFLITECLHVTNWNFYSTGCGQMQPQFVSDWLSVYGLPRHLHVCMRPLGQGGPRQQQHVLGPICLNESQNRRHFHHGNGIASIWHLQSEKGRVPDTGKHST